MMIKSMTGYGKGQARGDELAMTVEIKSVNHRFGDISVKTPRSLMALEGDIKKRVAQRLKRGKIDVFVNLEFTGNSILVPTWNRPLADAYLRIFEEMDGTYDLRGGIPLSLLAGQKDVISLQEAPLAEELLRPVMEGALDQALEAMEKMRQAEGEAMQRDIESRFLFLENSLKEVEGRAPEVPLEWQAKLKERLARLQQDVECDPQRVAQEIAIFADRCDISEEVVRFRSHLEQFRTLLGSDEPVGRQMDFLVQELNREVNTMGSKSNDAELTRLVVALKAELEKIREQVQNVE